MLQLGVVVKTAVKTAARTAAKLSLRLTEGAETLGLK